MQGITGGSLVMLSGGTNEASLLTGRSGQRWPVIESMPSQFERLLEGAPALIESVSIVVQQVEDLLRPGNRQAVDDVMQNLQTFSGIDRKSTRLNSSHSSASRLHSTHRKK